MYIILYYIVILYIYIYIYIDFVWYLPLLSSLLSNFCFPSLPPFYRTFAFPCLLWEMQGSNCELLWWAGNHGLSSSVKTVRIPKHPSALKRQRSGQRDGTPWFVAYTSAEVYRLHFISNDLNRTKIYFRFLSFSLWIK